MSKHDYLNIGTPEYKAVEMVSESSLVCPFKADLYTLGTAFYVMAYRRFPFESRRTKATAKEMNLKLLISLNPALSISLVAVIHSLIS